jgi:hypothetical protein
VETRLGRFRREKEPFMDPAAAFLMALGIWLILTEVVLPNLVVAEAEIPQEPTTFP